MLRQIAVWHLRWLQGNLKGFCRVEGISPHIDILIDSRGH
jgi:hypothetical protein